MSKNQKKKQLMERRWAIAHTKINIKKRKTK